MSLKSKKYLFFIIMCVCAVLFGYSLNIFFQNGLNLPYYDYAISLTFFLVTLMSFYEWLSIRKKLGDF